MIVDAKCFPSILHPQREFAVWTPPRLPQAPRSMPFLPMRFMAFSFRKNHIVNGPSRSTRSVSYRPSSRWCGSHADRGEAAWKAGSTPSARREHRRADGGPATVAPALTYCAASVAAAMPGVVARPPETGTAAALRRSRDQYAFAIGRSSAGKWVITLEPVSVTTTSSSMRAAEKPSEAGQ